MSSPETSLKPKIIAVVGPTSSGKSDLAVEIALRVGGEVISADSRQVYRGLSIGTGKISKEEMKGVPHHLLDVRDPREQFSVAEFKQGAEEAIEEIIARNNLPIIAGGTGYYVQAVVDGIIPPEVPPNPSLRQKLEEKSTSELFEELREKDPARAHTIERENPRRLIRALEIVDAIGKVPNLEALLPSKYESLKIGLQLPKVELRERINSRLRERIESGMIEEAKQLHKEGLSYERMEALGLEYRYLARYLQEKLTLPEMEKQLQFKIWQYAKRQLTWFKRDSDIHWFHPQERGKIFEVVESFLTK